MIARSLYNDVQGTEALMENACFAMPMQLVAQQQLLHQNLEGIWKPLLWQTHCEHASTIANDMACVDAALKAHIAWKAARDEANQRKKSHADKVVENRMNRFMVGWYCMRYGCSISLAQSSLRCFKTLCRVIAASIKCITSNLLLLSNSSNCSLLVADPTACSCFIACTLLHCAQSRHTAHCVRCMYEHCAVSELQGLLGDDPFRYKSHNFEDEFALDDWVVDEAAAICRGDGASLNAALQAYQCNAFLEVSAFLLMSCSQHST